MIMSHIRNYLKNRGMKDVGLTAVESMKLSISKGISPIRNVGRFDAYSSQRNSNKSGYPFNVQKKFPNKQVRPVNLNLSGKMLDALDFQIKDTSVIIGVFNQVEGIKALGHQLGDSKKNLPQRRFIPSKRGEEFIISITREIKNIIVKAIDKALK